MTSTPDLGQDQNAAQQIQAAVPLTRAQRLATYTPKVRKLRVAILSVGIGSVVSSLAAFLTFAWFMTQAALCTSSVFGVGDTCGSGVNGFADMIVGGFIMVIVMAFLGTLSVALSLALLVLGIVLITERNRSQGTWPAIVAIVLGALQLLTIVGPTLVTLVQNQTY